jgi:glycosyltransferase involved in cell wall biosynthesis
MPEFSVVIPSYNHARYVGDAIHSVLSQSNTDLELIVVDDGSTDDSLGVIYGIKDPRMKVVTQTNQGAHAAINRGLKTARGEYLAILNSDDQYHPQRLQKARDEFKADYGVGFVGSDIEIIDRNGKALGIKHGFKDCSPWPLEFPERSFRAGPDLHKALLTENFWSTTSNFIISRWLFEAVGEFRPLRYAHDWDFALRSARASRMKLLPEALMQYRVHDSNTINENQAAMVFEICWCLAVHLPEHLSDKSFINTFSDTVVDELLYSIHTFNMDKVLSVMLLQHLNENKLQALSLLETNNPTRASYLAYIQRELSRTSTGNKPAGSAQPSNLVRGLIKRIKGGTP